MSVMKDTAVREKSIFELESAKFILSPYYNNQPTARKPRKNKMINTVIAIVR